MPNRSAMYDYFMRNSAVGDMARGRPWAAAASAFGSAIGGPLLGFALGKLANRGYDARDRRNYVPGSPQPPTTDNNVGLALGMTDWGNLPTTQSDPNGYTYSDPASVGPPQEAQAMPQVPLMAINPKTGMPRNVSGVVNPNDAVGMSLLMGSLGFAGIGGGLGPDADAHMRPMVK